ncbi:MAG TPA: SusC/RagA family TonB-linked outer membrane protein, partial [Sphingobacterium sp.]|nr:SusC/RagA family TonB-linked outer membrane protein [Sphingobacterium sp.]
MQGSGIDFLKVRANWGRLGNQNVPLNVSQILSSPGSDNYNYVFGPEQDLVFGAAYGSPARNLRWEVTEETGLGLDFTLLSNRLSGNVDYYNKTNTNAILEVKPLLNSPFFQKYFDHGGKISNQGVEIGLNWTDQINENLSYSIGGNYSYNKNTLKEVKPAYDGAIGGSLNNGQITKQLKKGQPLYAWYMLESDGVWQTEAEIADGVATTGAKPGYLKYKDQNGDGVIDDNDKV